MLLETWEVLFPALFTDEENRKATWKIVRSLSSSNLIYVEQHDALSPMVYPLASWRNDLEKFLFQQMRGGDYLLGIASATSHNISASTTETPRSNVVQTT